MGDVKATCAVTGSAISSGQPVRLFFIGSNKGGYKATSELASISKGSISFHYDDFKIIGSVGIKANYVNYGRYKFDENSIEAQHILNEIKYFYVKNTVSPDRDLFNSHSVDIKRENLNFNKIQFMVNEGDLYISSYGRQFLNFVSVMAIHEDIYQMLINEETVHYIPSLNGYKTMYLKDVVQERLKEYERLKGRIEKEKDRVLDTIFEGELKTEKLQITALKIACSTLKLGEDYERHYVYGSRDSLSLLLEIYQNYPDETEESIVTRIIESRLFSEKLDQHNIMIRPTMTSYETKNIEDTIEFYKRTLLVLKDISEKEVESLYYEDEEDEE